MARHERSNITVYLDTAVWIPYVFHTHYAVQSKRNTYPIKLVEQLTEENDITILFTDFLSTEILTHLQEGIILRKLQEDGFSFKELNQYKKRYFLTRAENQELSNILTSIGELPNVTMLLTEGLSQNTVRNLLSMVSRYHFDFYDALHYEVARLAGCTYFVTTDSHLLTSIGEYQKGSACEVEAIKPKALYRMI